MKNGWLYLINNIKLSQISLEKVWLSKSFIISENDIIKTQPPSCVISK